MIERPNVDPLVLLRDGRIDPIGRIVGSSNASFVVIVSDDTDEHYAIYKPETGEKPLWDFPPGLFRRERAAYLLSEHLGWGIVPPTVIRYDAPYGVGSLQWYIEGSEREHYFTLVDDPDTHDALLRVAVFDCVTNNTDRKSGHVLRDVEGRIWGIDHGLCFGATEKLRTVIWAFARQPIPDALAADLAPLADAVPPDVAELLTGDECEALRARVKRLLDAGVLPVDDGQRRFPWPLV